MSEKKKKYREATELVHLGIAPEEYFGIPNPPIVRTSTILYPSVEAYRNPDHKYRYGRLGTPLSDRFEKAMTELEEGFGTVSTGSGVSALTLALMSFVKSGDHILVTDSVYPPTRDLCERYLKNFGIETEYYDPLIGGGISSLIRDNTSVIFLESPGSSTFEMQDVPAIAAAAKKRGVITIIDNTWAAGLRFKPIQHGVNISMQAATKYIGGHSDVNLGFLVADNEEHYKAIKKTAVDMGLCAAPEDLYLAIRGLHTLKLRMDKAQESAMTVAKWLQGRKEIQRVLFPALPDDPGHTILKRDFTGACGVFGIVLQPASNETVTKFIESLELFPIGSSWGGYESLIRPEYVRKYRTAVPWAEKGALLRLQIGLEDPQDLIEDLEQGFGKIKLAM
ncbi:MAG TPA: cystathionine beta-lyase [Rhodospirillaceae bacterium]|nr:cystathionine beta-lyase [Rhodospirillaceae bacterium]